MRLSFSWRTGNVIGFFLVVFLIISAIGVQYGWHLVPCPLCIFQRIAYFFLGLLFLFFCFFNKRFWLIKVQGFLLLLVAGVGLGIALRQVYLQHLPIDQAPSCGPGLDYLVNTLPWREVLSSVLIGSGECAHVDWTFFSLSMAEWSALWFLFFCGWALVLLIKKR